MKKVLFLVLLILLAVGFSSAALADEAYIISDYDVHIVVSEGNVLDVVERMTVNYSLERHGIYYYRQYAGTKYNEIDGEGVATPYRYKINDFKVQGYKYETTTYSDSEGKYLEAKIGDGNTYVIGEQVYVITYKFLLGDDRIEEFDEFYQNLIFCAYGDIVENASFIIEFPEDIDETQVVAFMGQYGETSGSGVTYEVDGNTIRGSILRPMQGGDVLTVRAQMPNGYYTDIKDPMLFWKILVFGLSGASALLALLLWLFFGIDKKVYPTVEFYPPKDMTSVEAGYVIDGDVDDKDVISMLIYWADKGYIKIIEHDKKDIDLQKIKDIDSATKWYERDLFNALFEAGDTVSVETFKDSFYVKKKKKKTGVINYHESNKDNMVFSKQSKKARAFMGILTVVPVASAMYMFMYNMTESFIWSVFVMVIVSMLISWPVFMLVRLFERWRSTERAKKMGKLIFSLILLGIVFGVYIIGMPFIFSDVIRPEVGIVITIITAGASLFLMWMASIMKKRTQQGGEWYGKLLGFKNFIEKAEKDRILLLVEENPSYFFNVLPFAYVLGVTDVWSKKFEGIAVKQPDWYSGYSTNAFTTMMFMSSINRSMSHVQSVATSRPTSRRCTWPTPGCRTTPRRRASSGCTTSTASA